MNRIFIQSVLFVTAIALIGLASPVVHAKKTQLEKSQIEKLPPPPLEDPDPLLVKILQSGHRSEKNKARDYYRHPLKTLDFFQVTSTMRVVEVYPGKGWYTEILSPYLKDGGSLLLAMPNGEAVDRWKNHIKSRPDFTAFEVLEIIDLSHPIAKNKAGSYDRVLTFRNVHSWMRHGEAEMMFRAFHALLKPGGLLGVVQHRLPEDHNFDPKAMSGYVSESHVIDLARTAGFALVDRSEINANPRDPKNFKEGVWGLPPVLAGLPKDKKQAKQERSRRMEIGESDRMTLTFVKKNSTR